MYVAVLCHCNLTSTVLRLLEYSSKHLHGLHTDVHLSRRTDEHFQQSATGTIRVDPNEVTSPIVTSNTKNIPRNALCSELTPNLRADITVGG
jgi:hypothetical protein